MHKRSLCLTAFPLIFAAAALPAQPGFYRLHLAGAATGMGTAGAALQQGTQALFINPGAFSVNSWEAAGGLCRPFGISEVTCTNVSAGIRTKTGCIGAAWTALASRHYTEQTMAVSWSGRLLPIVRAGLSLKKTMLTTGGRTDDAFPAADTGLLIHIGPHCRIGIACQGLALFGRGRRKQRFPFQICTGIAWQPDTHQQYCFDVIHMFPGMTEIHAGWEMRACRVLRIKCGFQTNPHLFTGGFALRHKNTVIHYAFTLHPELGLTHCFAFSINRQRKLLQ